LEKTRLIFSFDEIRSLGFPWPDPEVPMEFVVLTEGGEVDVAKTILSLRSQIASNGRVVSDAHAFRSAYAGQMSVLEYADHKEGYEDHHTRLVKCRRALKIFTDLMLKTPPKTTMIQYVFVYDCRKRRFLDQYRVLGDDERAEDARSREDLATIIEEQQLEALLERLECDNNEPDVYIAKMWAKSWKAVENSFSGLSCHE
jgi:hypothetical protein